MDGDLFTVYCWSAKRKVNSHGSTLADVFRQIQRLVFSRLLHVTQNSSHPLELCHGPHMAFPQVKSLAVSGLLKLYAYYLARLPVSPLYRQSFISFAFPS